MNEETLEPLGLVDENPSIGRRIEAMSRMQTYSVVALYGFCSICLISFLLFGPKYYVSTKIPFECKNSSSSNIRRYVFDFTNLHYFNDFLTIDFAIDKTDDLVSKPLNLSLSHFSVTTLGTHQKKYQTKPSTYSINFQNNSASSYQIPILSFGAVKFEKINIVVTMKIPFPVNFHGNIIASFADPAHSVVQIFLRFVFCILGTFVFIRLLLSDFELKNSYIAMRLIFYMDIAMIIGSNPLYILTYFTESPFIKFFDVAVGLFMMIFVAFTAFVVLLMKEQKHHDVSSVWLLCRFFPFFVAYLVFTFSSGYAVMSVDENPLSKINKITKALDTTKMVLVGIYILSFLYAAFTYKSDIPNEKQALVVMGFVMICTTISSELMNALEPFLGSDFAIQIFSFLSVSTYTLFFNFINWPVDSADILRDEIGDTNEKGEALVLNINSAPEI